MPQYKISNPYKNISHLLGESDRHYKTNLHTHSTYSDANNTMTEMIEGFYDYDFDILAFAEHGVYGKEWDKDPKIVPLFLFQNLWHGKREHPTTAQYKAILDGTYKTKNDIRTKKRGLNCLPFAIECNMFTIMKNHVNGYFTDNACEGIYGKEFDYEIPIKKIEQSGGISHINHPTDILDAKHRPDCAENRENVLFFTDLLRRYKSCLGIEVLNLYDIVNRSDRILWDKILKILIPEGERNIWGFSNSDAHDLKHIDKAFMDFILPEYTHKNMRSAMENGEFFSIARYARNELGEDFEGEGEVPVVTEITVDDDNNVITVKGKNCNAIEWIADGEIIKSDVIDFDGETVSTIKLGDYSEKISCYVRFQLKGRGGILLSQPFICDDGNMARFIQKDAYPTPRTKQEMLKKRFFSTRFGVILNKTILKKMEAHQWL